MKRKSDMDLFKRLQEEEFDKIKYWFDRTFKSKKIKVVDVK